MPASYRGVLRADRPAAAWHSYGARISAAVHHWPEGGHHGAAAWADDFAEFAALQRGAHCRSLSDSVAFVEVAPADGAAGEFDRLDDDQLMSMFPDEAGGGSSSAPGSENGGCSNSDGDKRGGVPPRAAPPMAAMTSGIRPQLAWCVA